MQDRPPTGSIPDAPGSYQFYDAEGRVLYVGKAKSLRHRLPNYWQDSAKLLPRTAQMVAQADHVEWVVVDTEVDALILEHSLIQAHLPRYNVRLKDDKSYPWLAVTAERGVAPPGGRAGPQAQGRPLLRPLRPRRRHPLRRSTCWCAASRSARARTPSSPATSGSGGPACSTTSTAARAPASARWTTRPTTATSTTSWGSSRATPSRCWPAWRPRCWPPPTSCSSSGRPGCATASRRCTRRPRPSRWCPTGPEDFDVVGLAEDPLEASVQIFRVRRGRVVGHRGFVAEKVEDLTGPEFMARVVSQVYGADGAEVPRRVLVPEEPADLELLQSWLRDVRDGPGRHRRARSAAPSGRCRRRSPGPPARTWPATGCAGPPTTTRAPRR